MGKPRILKYINTEEGGLGEDIMTEIWTQPEDSMKALDLQRVRVEQEQSGCFRIKFSLKILLGVAFCHHLVLVGVC